MLLDLGSLPADGKSSRLPILGHGAGWGRSRHGGDCGACKASVVAAPINVGSGGVHDNDEFGLLRSDHDHHDHSLFKFAPRVFQFSA